MPLGRDRLGIRLIHALRPDPDIPVHMCRCHLAVLEGRLPGPIPLLRRQLATVRPGGLQHGAGLRHRRAAARTHPRPQYKLAPRAAIMVMFSPGIFVLVTSCSRLWLHDRVHGEHESHTATISTPRSGPYLRSPLASSKPACP